MIDNFSLLLSHGLLLYMFIRLIGRDDVDKDGDDDSVDAGSHMGAHGAPKR